ncbi:DUF6308 family protein (plasmid) [Rhodococcus opacus]|nr:DUF6308 family protein [Rhodococcus opacus]MDJ0420226.1 DUF6308 family protein [Rhodococcus opacus]MDV7090109.1 DUF6308 family protein [Rhodococcus opacus]UNN05105.1 DUF6308 family protein [Rhodococcus opacus]WKN52699.1 DUF6308 family protein [Rhodococcus opacus]
MPGIGRRKATKLIARKRPRLYPIWDSRRSPPARGSPHLGMGGSGSAP